MNIDKEKIINNKNKVFKFSSKHKYSISILLLVIYLGFVDETSFLNRYYQKQNIKAIESEIDNYKKNTNINLKRLEDYNRNSNNIERLAREKFYFKKDNEDVFVIIDNSEDN
jgi:cell division protein FtsB